VYCVWREADLFSLQLLFGSGFGVVAAAAVIFAIVGKGEKETYIGKIWG